MGVISYGLDTVIGSSSSVCGVLVHSGRKAEKAHRAAQLPGHRAPAVFSRMDEHFHQYSYPTSVAA